MKPEQVKPRVVHCKREKYDVYIGRPSKWGNPIKLIKDTPTERQQVLAAPLRPMGMYILGHASGFAFRGIAQSRWGSE